jgi:hypothetical protein
MVSRNLSPRRMRRFESAAVSILDVALKSNAESGH